MNWTSDLTAPYALLVASLMQTKGEAMAFPDVLSDVSTEALVGVFEAAPARLRLALDGLSDADEIARPIAGKWSIREIVAHLADAETVGAARFRFTLAEPGVQLPVYDEAAWARALDYQDAAIGRLADTLALFSALRSASARVLRRQPDDAWRRRARHPQWGDVTLRELLELYTDHGERHIEQIVERRVRLGRPVAVEPLLAARLY